MRHREIDDIMRDLAGDHSVSAGTLPRYGTCWALAPIILRNISMNR